MKLSAILAPLIAAKVSHEIIMQTVQAWEAEQSDALAKRRESDAIRQARQRERNVTSRDVTVTVSSHAGASRVEDNLQTKNQAGQEEKKERTAPAALSDLADFKAEFTDLDSEHLEALVKHRRSKKAAMTALSARLFRRDAVDCGLSMAQAVETCIARNWVTVRPDYLAPKGRSQAPPPKKTTMASMWRDEGRKIGILDEPASTTDRRLEASLARGPDQGTNFARRIASAGSG